MIKQNDFQLFWEWPEDDAMCWDGKRHHLPWPLQGPDLASLSCKVAAPAESYWRCRPPDTQPRPEHCQDSRPDSKFWNVHNTQKKLSYASLPEALIPPACQSSLGWNQPSQRNILIVKRSPGEGLDCKTHPTLSSVAITATAFGLHFQDLWKSLS